MTAAEIAASSNTQFGSAITGKKLDALDPFVTVEPAKLVEVCTFLRDDPRLKFETPQRHHRRRLPRNRREEGRRRPGSSRTSKCSTTCRASRSPAGASR